MKIHLPQFAVEVWEQHELAATNYAKVIVDAAYHTKPTAMTEEWWQAMRETMHELLRLAFIDGAINERQLAATITAAREVRS